MKKKILKALGIVGILALMSTMIMGCGDKKDVLYVYNFGDYIDPDLVEEFQEETGIEVVYSTFDTNEEMYPTIKNQSANYDVICASDYMLEKMIGEDLLAEIDYKNVPNSENLIPELTKNVELYDPGAKHMVPHTWGTMGILYNTKKIPEGNITSWNDLWKEEYSGKIVMPDSVRDTMAIGLKAKGYSLNSTDEKEVNEAADYLIKQKPLVYKYANDSARDLLASGSADIGVVWNGEYIYTTDLNPDLEFVIPQEGSEEFIDAWAIPKSAQNKEAAEKWINFMLSKEASLKNFEYLCYTIPNNHVKNEGPKELLSNEVIFPPAELLTTSESLKYLGPEGDDLYSKAWKKFKAK